MAAGQYYSAPYCGGIITGVGKGHKSGKGEARGPGRGASGMRNNQVMLWPSWGKKGTDVYCSSRWTEDCQIYDLYWTPLPMDSWWLSAPYDWVFMQELPYDKNAGDFVWSFYKPVNKKTLWHTRHRQWQQFLKTSKKQKRAKRAAWAARGAQQRWA